MHLKSSINKVHFIKIYTSRKLLKCTYWNKIIKANFIKCRYTYFVHEYVIGISANNKICKYQEYYDSLPDYCSCY